MTNLYGKMSLSPPNVDVCLCSGLWRARFSGWTKTGTAFDFQPTYGDNPVYRAPASSPQSLHQAGHGQSTGLKGRYFVGTYEKRPGNGSDSYTEPHPAYPAGSLAVSGWLS